TRRGVDSRTTPLTTTIESRKDDRATSKLKRCELSLTTHLFELVHCPRMRLGGAIRQHIFCESLPGKGLNTLREWLRLGRHLTRNISLRHRFFLDREKRCAIRPIKNEEDALLACLRHGIHH